MFGSGLNIVHPQPPLASLAGFVMPEDLIEGRGYPSLTDETRRKILGGTAARIHGIDPAEVLDKAKADEFSAAKQDGLRPPWSGLREYAQPFDA
jgi:hypothetical protein